MQICFLQHRKKDRDPEEDQTNGIGEIKQEIKGLVISLGFDRTDQTDQTDRTYLGGLNVCCEVLTVGQWTEWRSWTE